MSAAYLRELIPDASERKAACEQLARSIRYAHAQGPASWEVTALRSFIRLNVGQIAVAEVDGRAIYLYAVKGSTPRVDGITRLVHRYDAVDVDTERWEIFLDVLLNVPDVLLERHEALIAAAASAKRKTPFARSHSPAIVAAIARIAGGQVPQPDYQTPFGPNATLGRNRADQSESLFGDPEQNARVERAAIEVVASRLEQEGWSVRSVETAQRGYDLHCTSGARELHVEVKGTVGEPRKFVLTAGELKRAHSDKRFELFVVGQALSRTPTVERWKGQSFEDVFKLEPLQFVASRAVDHDEES